MKPVRVYLTGGEGIGWALDESLALTRRTLAPLADLVAIAPLASADVAYSEDPVILAAHADHQLDGKRLVCQADNDVLRLMEQVHFARPRQIVGLWAAQNRTDERRLRAAGLRVALIPLPLDTDLYPRRGPDTAAEVDAFRTSRLLPKDRFLIGNFMRDSLGGMLDQPKPQKAPEVFLAIIRVLHARGLPVHAVLAGPRRHWLRERMLAEGLPMTFIGDPVAGDDLKINILDKPTLSLLYRSLDLYLVTSRWESGSRVILEAAASGCPILSTPVGLSPDILERVSIFTRADEAIVAVERQMRERHLDATLDVQRERVLRDHTTEANAKRYRTLYEHIDDVPPYRPASARRTMAAARGRAVSFTNRVAARLGLRRPAQRPRIRISLWHEFHKPPFGGGNQFMLALRGALEGLGADVVVNRTGASVDVHLANSLWFDVGTLETEKARRPIRLVHRIDGPISLYRGGDKAEDDRIFRANATLAGATILQSAWSYERLCEMGYRPVNPFIVHNAVDPAVFHARGRRPFERGRKVRLIASSWSDNPRKGGPLYAAMERLIDWNRFEFTFVGRTEVSFSRIRCVPALDSAGLAALLREHDIYVTASRNDPCSNALIEGLACGLPALYLHDGGHPELVQHGGLGFADVEEVPDRLNALVDHYELFQNLIAVDDVESVARRYLDIARYLVETL